MSLFQWLLQVAQVSGGIAAFGIPTYVLARILATRSVNWPDRIPDTKKAAWAERFDSEGHPRWMMGK